MVVVREVLEPSNGARAWRVLLLVGHRGEEQRLLDFAVDVTREREMQTALRAGKIVGSGETLQAASRYGPSPRPSLLRDPQSPRASGRDHDLARGCDNSLRST